MDMTRPDARLGVLQALGVAFAIGAIACGRGRPGLRLSTAFDPEQTLRIANADNRGASLAAAGDRVVAAWAATIGEATNVYVSVSEDDGRQFGRPIRVNDIDGDARVNGEQPPRVAIGNDIVVAWESRRAGSPEIRMARSIDGGHTFAPAQTNHAAGLPGVRGWASVALDGSGTAHTAWLDGRNAAPRTPAPAGHPMSHDRAEPIRQDIFHAATRPDGTRVESMVATGVCFCCKTSVAVAPDGSTYVAWRHVYPTNLRDMAVARSADGRSFDPPVRVSEDGWEIASCPEDGPSLVVDAANVVHIAWPTIAAPGATQKAIFYSYSTDHGRTFAPRVRIDDRPGVTFGAHPQLTLVGGAVAITWEERTGTNTGIRARLIGSDAAEQWHPVLQPIIDVADAPNLSYPAVAGAADSLLVSWILSAPSESDLHLRRIPVVR